MTKLQDTIPDYIAVQRNLSQKSRHTYFYTLSAFTNFTNKNVSELCEQDLSDFITYLTKRNCAASTISLYVSSIVGLFDWLTRKRLWYGNLSDIRYIAKHEKPKIIQQTPDYDRDLVADLIAWAARKDHKSIISKRDAFLVLAAASTGCRLGKELCSLKRGQINWQTGRALVIGKGDKEGKIRFSQIALEAGLDYLKARAPMDGTSGLPLSSLPLFINHRTKTKIKSLGYHGARKSLRARVVELFGKEKAKEFHPHLLRHEFVSRILEKKGNLKMAQEMARHVNIETTKRYAHLIEDELDKAYDEVFNQ